MPPPEIIETCRAMREYCDRARRDGLSIGFVPTMGSLHEGHLSLMRRAAADSDRVVVSVFVNPAQFGPNEDYEAYHRDLTGDVDKCAGAGVDVVFAPPAQEMYAPGACTLVDQSVLTEVLCGAFRPGHFRGVLTVVAKLFNIIGPCGACFGQKDYQQFVVIRRMAADLNFPVELTMCPTVREPDGLAMSSRNRYLSESERRDALCLYDALSTAKALFEQGERRGTELVAQMRCRFEKTPAAKVDYVAVVDPETLQPLSMIRGAAVAAVAVRLGPARLIDNMILGQA